MSDTKKEAEALPQESAPASQVTDETITTLDNHMPSEPAADVITTMDNHMPAPPALGLDGGK
ncbi:hypothetical protein ACFWBB_06185 [Streptomyces sp. NPDC060000]|uniref:hypothetical protein n=1 Tax=Streptomyces sp. NPDC060000 TaxID=3347031 RepID=UPI0036A0EA0A